MKKLLGCFLLTLSSVVFASPYLGVSYTGVNTDVTDHNGASIVAGFEFNDYLSAEGRYMFTATEETKQSVDVELESLYGAYLKFSLPIHDQISPYLVAGYSEGKAKASYMGYSLSDTDSSASYGLGVQVELSENWDVNAEYMSLMDDIDSLSIGIKFNF